MPVPFLNVSPTGPTGRHVFFGRTRKPQPRPVMRLRSYADLHTAAALPPPPAAVNYWNPATAAALKNIYLNDQLGDCVIACGYHLVGLATGNANGGKPFVATDAQIIHDYNKIGGYVPGNPATDNGCNEQDALDYWTKVGFANGTRLAGYLTVDGSNKTEVMQALFLFENLFFGIELPDAWVSPFPEADGFVWDVAGPVDNNNGHCIMGVGYNADGVLIDSWGLRGLLTWEGMAYATPRQGGELYVALTPDMLAKGQAKAPNGLDWAALVRDFDALGGSVPQPSPVVVPPVVPPAPPKPPSPVVVPPVQHPGLTLTEAQQVASQAVVAALAAHWPKGFVA